MSNKIKQYNTFKTHLVRDKKEYKDNSFVGKNIKIFHNNVRSIGKNFDEVKLFINYLEESFDLIVLTETWKISNPNLFNIPNYNLIYNEGDINKNDGIIIFIKDNYDYNYEIIPIDIIKCIYIKIRFDINTFMNILSIYRPPSTCPFKFTSNLNKFLENNKTNFTTNCSTILIGDINIDILSKSLIANIYYNVLSEHGFISLINNYTRKINDENSCLDHIFIKSKQNLEQFKTFIFEYQITDHYPLIIQSKLNYNIKTKNNDIFKTYLNYNKLINLFSKIDWTKYYKLKTSNELANYLIEIVQTNTEKCKHKIKLKKRKRKEWITNGLINSINTKNELYKQLKRNPNNVLLLYKYKLYKNKLNSLIKKTKINYYKKQIDKNCKTSKNLWDCIKKICNEKKKQNFISDIKLFNGEISNDEKIISNNFINYFSEIGEKLANKIKNDNHNDYNNNLTETLPTYSNSIYLKRTNYNEITNLIESLKPRKSPGFDNITSEILKTIKCFISKPLAHLINIILETGECPKAFKIGIIKPIYKNGDKKEIQNYRPITLISSLGKIFEKVLKDRIESYLKKQNYLSDKQFGFQYNKSTNDAICYLTNNIYQSMDKSKPCICIFLDLAKAFDTVSHKLLIHKLEKIGFRDNVLKLIKSYLENRPQYVKIGNTLSNSKIYKYGVPQGSILGPLFFNIYLNDLFNLKCIGKLHSFADDTVIFYDAIDWKTLQQTIKTDFLIIKNWFDNNLLTINFKKTNYLPITSYSNNLPKFKNIEITNNIQITEANNVKYLGIIIDKHLKWNLQIEYVINKLRCMLSKFKYLKNILNKNYLNMLYFSLIQSHLNYGILGWGSVSNKYLNNLEVIQKWFLKIIYNKDYTYSSNLLYKESKKMDIKQLFCYNILKYIYKNKIKININEHNHNTRNKYETTLKEKVNKSIGQKNFKYLLPFIYDRLPKNLKLIKSYTTFKNKIKEWIISMPRHIFHDILHN